MKPIYGIKAHYDKNIYYVYANDTDLKEAESNLKMDANDSDSKKLLFTLGNVPDDNLLKNAKILKECELFNLSSCLEQVPKMADELIKQGYTLLQMDEAGRGKLHDASRSAYSEITGVPQTEFASVEDKSRILNALEEYAVSESTKKIIQAVTKHIEPEYDTLNVRQAWTSYFQHNTLAVNKHTDYQWALIFSANLSKGTNPTVLYTNEGKEVAVPDGYAVIFTGGGKIHPTVKGCEIVDKMNKGKAIEHIGGEDKQGVRTNLTNRYWL